MTVLPSPAPAGPRESNSELKATLNLAWPLALAFGGDQLLGVVDSLVAGRLGAVALAAVGVGNAIFMGLTIFGVGLIGAVEPLAAQAFGMQREDLASRAYRSAIVVSLVATIPFLLGVQALGELVAEWGQLEAETKNAVIAYLFMRSFSVLPVFLATAARNYLQSRQDTRAIVWSTVIANLLNVPLSIVLGFGDSALMSIGLPGVGLGVGMGVAGLGLASTLVSGGRLFVLWRRIHKVMPRPENAEPLSSGVGQLIRVGWPIGLHWFLEVGVFVAVTVVAGHFGTRTVAGHQIALQLSTLTFCICLGLSSAATVRVGRAIGRQDQHAARDAALKAALTSVFFMVSTAVLFTAFPEWLASLFSSDPKVVAAGADLLRIVALFQVADGIQAVMAGALRGLGETRTPMVLNAIGHWLLGLPIGLWLSFERGLEAEGLWWGLTIGLAFSAVTLSWRFAKLSSQPVGTLEEGT